MTSADPLAPILQACEALDKAQSTLAAHVTDSQADEIRAKIDELRGMLVKMQEQMGHTDQEGPPLPLNSVMAAQLLKLRVRTAALNDKHAAQMALQANVPPPTPLELLDGHKLGKLLLAELGIVQPATEKKPRLVDEAGYGWESSKEWDAFGR